MIVRRRVWCKGAGETAKPLRMARGGVDRSLTSCPVCRNVFKPRDGGRTYRFAHRLRVPNHKRWIEVDQ